ncbi:MAG: hypothetical protein COZ18_01045 [Flexibacter sp. CG_4_10_14_3_um_filter_32_15]|nr:MAG: hypothetical protein COZ18_01045 [Flexibacter sp. CG_4_10_14_3_um_filter_32_15]
MMLNYSNKLSLTILFLLFISCTKPIKNQSIKDDNSKTSIKYKYYRSVVGGGMQIKGVSLDSCLSFPDSIKIVAIDDCFVKQTTFDCFSKGLESIVLNSCWTDRNIVIKSKGVENFRVHFNNSNVGFFILKNIDYIGMVTVNLSLLDERIIQGNPKSIHLLAVDMRSINLSKVDKLEIYDSVVDSIKIDEIDTLIMNHLYREPILKVPSSTVVIRSGY